MKKVFALLLVPLLMSACIRVTTESEDVPKAEHKTDGVFIHISKGAADTHTVLMALMLADKFSVSNDVLVFFDRQGVEMVARNAPDLGMEPFDSSDDIFKRLLDRNVTILACPACMEVAGLKAGDLREGVGVAEKEQFFDFTEGRILTLDY